MCIDRHSTRAPNNPFIPPQVMLNAPNALFRMGLYAGIIIMVFFIIAGFW